MNPIECKGSYSATSNYTKLVHWPVMGCYIWCSKEETGLAPPLLAVPNVTAHPSMASVPITVLMYSGLLLCGFNVRAREGLNTFN